MSIFQDDIRELTDLERIDEISKSSPSGVAIFKHSTRCIVSKMILRGLESEWKIAPETLPTFYLDLLSYRVISNAISERYGVEHQSPQMLVIKDGTCIWHDSHHGVQASYVEKIIHERV